VVDAKSLEVLASRARQARWALAFNVGIHAFGALIGAAQAVFVAIYDVYFVATPMHLLRFENMTASQERLLYIIWLGGRLAMLYQFATLLGLLVGGIAFLRWTGRVFAVGGGVAPSRRLVPYPGRTVVMAFLIPLVNVYRPFRAFSILNEEVDPADLPKPPAVANPGDATGGYRETAALAVTPASSTPSAPVGAWWALWLGRLPLAWLGTGVGPADHAVLAVLLPILEPAWDAGTAVLAMSVVGRITARIRERARRLEHAPASERAI
jgi:hypothetical protein